MVLLTSIVVASGADLSTLEQMRNDDRCPFYDMGTVFGPYDPDPDSILPKDEYYKQLKTLDIEQLYEAIKNRMLNSTSCWPADGPQDGDIASYAALFVRLAWHCAGTFQLASGPGSLATGGCEGGVQRFWPENEWHDNANLDKARALLAPIKNQFKDQLSWGDLITFAGTVAIKASGGPAEKFCFGRVDQVDGLKSVPLGVEGVEGCPGCQSHAPCANYFRWPEQSETDHFQCNMTQADGRHQASHSVGLIYVFPEGPELKSSAPGYDPTAVHNRSPKLSALEVRDVFSGRMGWTDQETVALIGGGHTLGRNHGNCNLTGTKWADHPFNSVGPFFEAVPGSGRGPTDGTCGHGLQAGLGPNTVTSGFEGPWTRTPSRWNYDFFEATLSEDWVPTKSPFGADQWRTRDQNSKFANTRRLTTDVALAKDSEYMKIASTYRHDHAKFDSDFAHAWFKLMHRSGEHPHEKDLEQDAGICTNFEFVSE